MIWPRMIWSRSWVSDSKKFINSFFYIIFRFFFRIFSDFFVSQSVIEKIQIWPNSHRPRTQWNKSTPRQKPPWLEPIINWWFDVRTMSNKRSKAKRRKRKVTRMARVMKMSLIRIGKFRFPPSIWVLIFYYSDNKDVKKI